MEALNRKANYEFNKLQRRLRRDTGRAIQDFNMIENGDRVMVCLSGGADSFTLLDMLLNLRRKAPVDFEMLAVNLDQKQPGFPADVLPSYLESIGMPYKILEQDTYSVVRNIVPDGDTMCGLCSRLRRGALYTFAREQGFNRIALGHHRDDIIETLFLNMFHGGKLKAMPPKLLSDDGANVVIRPLAYCREADIKTYAEARGFPVIPCNLCGSQDNLQRQAIKAMLREWDRKHSGRSETIFAAIRNLVPSHLADPSHYDFRSLGSRAEAAAGSQNWLAGEE
ncbi:MAG: tRNA 2-thiocytidine(32) synthetase TtcA [Gammaproteobacteria bacterium]|nr:MAG: tRNA 2-thiocytidine(32) synthetase TtcA [Gammaproteobacteria bacterium]